MAAGRGRFSGRCEEAPLWRQLYLWEVGVGSSSPPQQREAGDAGQARDIEREEDETQCETREVGTRRNGDAEEGDVIVDGEEGLHREARQQTT
jgi:hypothetical protein